MPTYKTVYWGDEDYRIGDDGTFWSRKVTGIWRERKPSKLSKADPRPGVSVRIAGKLEFVMIYHVVLRTFVGAPPPGHEACHFPDRDPWNNALTNLRWDTRKNNFADRDVHGTTARGERSPKAKLKEAQVLEIRRLHKTGEWSYQRLAAKFGIDQSNVGYIVKRRSWRHLSDAE